MTSNDCEGRADWLGESDRMLGLLNDGFPVVEKMDAAAARAAVAARARPVDNLDDVRSAEDIQIADGPRVRIYRPWSEPSGACPAILFMHGGGFVFCSIESHDGFCRRMSKNTGSVVVSVDYRLAPEHRAPAAAEDAYAALSWLAAKSDKLGLDRDRMLIAGDSAGGNLAAVACLMARDRDEAMPMGQVLLYPVVAPDFETESYRRYETGHCNTRAAMQWYWGHYLGGEALPEPEEYVAPLRAATHAGLPPALIYTTGRDPLCSEGEQYATTLRAASVQIRHRNFPELFHGFATIPNFGPANAALEMLWRDINGFFGLHRKAQA